MSTAALKRLPSVRQQRQGLSVSEIVILSQSEFIIGRDHDAHYCIDKMEVSRRHCKFERKPNKNIWSITDLKSTNGIFINGNQLVPLVPRILRSTDQISLGPPSTSPHIFQFIDNYKPQEAMATTNQTPSRVGIQRGGGIENFQNGNQRNQIEFELQRTNNRQRVDGIQRTPSEHRAHTIQRERFIHRAEGNQRPGRNQINERIQTNQRSNEIESRNTLAEVTGRSDEARRRRRIEPNHSDAWEIPLPFDGQSSGNQLNQNENRRSISSGNLETNKRPTGIQTKSEADLNQIVEKPITKRKELEQADVSLKKRLRNDFDSELTCTICQELYVEATNLNCSHTFCFTCIQQWKASSSSVTTKDCPICRVKISSESRILLVDNLVEKVVDSMTNEEQEQRKQLIEERKMIAEKLKKKQEERRNQRQAFFVLSSREGNLRNLMFPEIDFASYALSLIREENINSNTASNSNTVVSSSATSRPTAAGPTTSTPIRSTASNHGFVVLESWSRNGQNGQAPVFFRDNNRQINEDEEGNNNENQATRTDNPRTPFPTRDGRPNRFLISSTRNQTSASQPSRMQNRFLNDNISNRRIRIEYEDSDSSSSDHDEPLRFIEGEIYQLARNNRATDDLDSDSSSDSSNDYLDSHENQSHMSDSQSEGSNWNNDEREIFGFQSPYVINLHDSDSDSSFHSDLVDSNDNHYLGTFTIEDSDDSDDESNHNESNHADVDEGGNEDHDDEESNDYHDFDDSASLIDNHLELSLGSSSSSSSDDSSFDFDSDFDIDDNISFSTASSNFD